MLTAVSVADCARQPLGSPWCQTANLRSCCLARRRSKRRCERTAFSPRITGRSKCSPNADAHCDGRALFLYVHEHGRHRFRSPRQLVSKRTIGGCWNFRRFLTSPEEKYLHPRVYSTLLLLQSCRCARELAVHAGPRNTAFPVVPSIRSRTPVCVEMLAWCQERTFHVKARQAMKRADTVASSHSLIILCD